MSTPDALLPTYEERAAAYARRRAALADRLRPKHAAPARKGELARARGLDLGVTFDALRAPL